MKPFLSIILFLLTIAPAAQAVLAATTGSRLGVSAAPLQIVRFAEPVEIVKVRNLLSEGRREDALVVAQDYLKIVEAAAESPRSRYVAWNALCTALTANGRTQDAIDACSRAMGLQPGLWSAVNNRGTAKLVAGLYSEALADYQRALALAPQGNDDARAAILHNMRLAHQRLDLRETGDSP